MSFYHIQILLPSLSIRCQYDFIIENHENFILKMQYWGHFKITCIAYFNKIPSGTLIFYGPNISIFRILEVSISVTGAPGDPKIFFRYSPIDVSNMSFGFCCGEHLKKYFWARHLLIFVSVSIYLSPVQRKRLSLEAQRQKPYRVVHIICSYLIRFVRQ